MRVQKNYVGSLSHPTLKRRTFLKLEVFKFFLQYWGRGHETQELERKDDRCDSTKTGDAAERKTPCEAHNDDADAGHVTELPASL